MKNREGEVSNVEAGWFKRCNSSPILPPRPPSRPPSRPPPVVLVSFFLFQICILHFASRNPRENKVSQQLFFLSWTRRMQVLMAHCLPWNVSQCVLIILLESSFKKYGRNSCREGACAGPPFFFLSIFLLFFLKGNFWKTTAHYCTPI